MEEKDSRKEPQSSFRGLYRHVKISVKTLDKIIIALIAYRTQYLAFRDALSGIDGEMAYKWIRQWNLFKISLLAMGAGLLFSIILSLLGLVIILGGIGVLLFVMIREYVYLYQTAQICRSFSEREN